MLDELSIDEDGAGRGLITVLVVHKSGDYRPGPGFFELAASGGRDVSDIDRTWLRELRTVWGHWLNN
jgi:DNA-binding IclR family transcriptional regulator